VPGPLIRIPLGTTIDATITNSLADTLAEDGGPLRNPGPVIRVPVGTVIAATGHRCSR